MEFEKFRKQIPKISIKEEMKFIVITNFRRIAAKLKKDPKALSRFFSYETKKKVQYSHNLGTLRIDGDFLNEELEAILDFYIRLFAACPKCQLFGINLYKKHNNNDCYWYRCEICQEDGVFESAHRLTPVIIV